MKTRIRLRHGMYLLTLSLFAFVAPAEHDVMAQRGGRPPPGRPPEPSPRPEPPHRDPSEQTRHTEDSSRTQFDDMWRTDNPPPIGSPEKKEFRDRVKAALQEVVAGMQFLSLGTRFSVAGHACCDFMRPAATKFADLYKWAESNLRENYFGMPFKAHAHRFIYTTDDTVILGRLHATKLAHFEIASDNAAWSNDAHIRTQLERLRKVLGKGGRVIMVGHQENGEIVIRHTQGDRAYNIATLQKMARSLNLELLVWSCESAQHAIGGTAQAFRESKLTDALISALSSPASTLGGFLDQISKVSEVRFIYNAVQMMELQQAIATVESSEGRAVEVQMPTPERGDGWASAGAGTLTSRANTAMPVISMPDLSTQFEPVKEVVPASRLLETLRLLRMAMQVVITVFLVTVLFGGLSAVLLRVPGVYEIRTTFTMSLGFAAVILIFFSAVGLIVCVATGNIAAGAAGGVLGGLAWLCYKAIRLLDTSATAK